MTGGVPRRQIRAPWLEAPSTQAVFTALEADGYQVRAVGGAVRNSLLGLPATDIDIATTALPHETLAAASRAGLKTFPTGLAHGTVTVMAHGIPHEVTTLRRDTDTDGRHAIVAFTSDWAADASRRDFTINALYCDRRGEIYDPLGGLVDLNPARIRFIGDPKRRIEEDYLRILRFFRMSATFLADDHLAAYGLDKEGLVACKSLAAGLAQISGERIQSELFKLLRARQVVPVLAAMVDANVLTHIWDLPANVRALARLVQIESQLPLGSDQIRRLAALCVRAPADVSLIDRRLKLASKLRQQLLRCAGMQVERTLSLDDAKAMIYRFGAQTFLDRLLLGWAQSDADIGDDAYRQLALQAGHFSPPNFPLKGADVIERGVTPGPGIKAMLAQIEAEWIANGFQLDRSALLARLDVLIGAMSQE
jgi:poly(A) polymerase